MTGSVTTLEMRNGRSRWTGMENKGLPANHYVSGMLVGKLQAKREVMRD